MTFDQACGSFGQGRSSLLGTRIHAQIGPRPDISDLGDWCGAALRCADALAIAADTTMHDEVVSRVAHLGEQVQVLHVSPWFGFTPALNAIVGEAKRRDVDKLILMSREVHPERTPLDAIKTWIRPNVLVVGARLSPDHGASTGVQILHAYNSPWNTLAVWNAHMLGLTGFPSISDGHRNDVPAGMEEVITISLLQQLYGERAHAYLVEAPGIHWQHPSNDIVRDAAHRAKMQSKVERAEAQLQRMGIRAGRVEVFTHARAEFVMAPTLLPGSPDHEDVT